MLLIFNILCIFPIQLFYPSSDAEYLMCFHNQLLLKEIYDTIKERKLKLIVFKDDSRQNTIIKFCFIFYFILWGHLLRLHSHQKSNKVMTLHESPL